MTGQLGKYYGLKNRTTDYQKNSGDLVGLCAISCIVTKSVINSSRVWNERLWRQNNVDRPSAQNRKGKW